MENTYRQRRRKSNFVRLFDKTPPGIICPHFYILAHANGCPYDCSYCYLQLTFRGKTEPVLFRNLDDLNREVRQFLELPEPSVLNAGELSDGLAFDHITRLSRSIVPMFAVLSKRTGRFRELRKSRSTRRETHDRRRKNQSLRLPCPFQDRPHNPHTRVAKYVRRTRRPGNRRRT
jgi:hypothetical protein